mgnify:CR=1 FL=1
MKVFEGNLVGEGLKLAIVVSRHAPYATYHALPAYPEPEDRQAPSLVLGEVHHLDRPGRAPDPQWLVIPQRGLYTGLMVLGAVGALVVAARLGLDEGVDFLKTSTGKTGLNATLGNNQVMLEAIRDHYLATGVAIGMKPAGGIRTAKQALQFLVAVKETLGDAWLDNTRYRFGASALLNDLLRQMEKERTGAYQRPDHFTLD